MNPNVESRIKAWLFPGIAAILATIIWQDVKEIKADVKALITQSSKDMIRIDNLERELYNNKPVSKSENPLPSIPQEYQMPVFLPVKPEELYEIKKDDKV